MIGYMEAVTGIGLIMGPLIGSFLYGIGGYKFIFFSFGGLFIFLSFFVHSVFPASVDCSTSEANGSSNISNDDFHRPEVEFEDEVEADNDDYHNAEGDINIDEDQEGYQVMTTSRSNPA